MKDIILYHGSKDGIKGNISPISRELCDFGKGFYLGESKEQAKSIVCEYSNPVLYKIQLKLSEMPEEKILKLDGNDWLFAILASRKMISDFNSLPIAQEWLDKCKKYDVIIGKIADDKMNEAMTRFAEYGLTDKGLQACLLSVRYGNQYVLKTEFACSKAVIIEKKKLFGSEIDNARKYSQRMRYEAKNCIYDCAIKYRNNGKYLDQIIEEEKNKLGFQIKGERDDY